MVLLGSVLCLLSGELLTISDLGSMTIGLEQIHVHYKYIKKSPNNKVL